MSFIHDAACNCDSKILHIMSKANKQTPEEKIEAEAMIDWHRGHQKYILDLMSKMKNRSVSNEECSPRYEVEFNSFMGIVLVRKRKGIIEICGERKETDVVDYLHQYLYDSDPIKTKWGKIEEAIKFTGYNIPSNLVKKMNSGQVYDVGEGEVEVI